MSASGRPQSRTLSVRSNRTLATARSGAQHGVRNHGGKVKRTAVNRGVGRGERRGGNSSGNGSGKTSGDRTDSYNQPAMPRVQPQRTYHKPKSTTPKITHVITRRGTWSSSGHSDGDCRPRFALEADVAAENDVVLKEASPTATSNSLRRGQTPHMLVGSSAGVYGGTTGELVRGDIAPGLDAAVVPPSQGLPESAPAYRLTPRRSLAINPTACVEAFAHAVR